MDSKNIHESKRCLKDKITSRDDYLLDDEIDDDVDEEDFPGGGNSFIGDDKNKGLLYGKRGGSGGGASPPSCQVERCGTDLSEAKRYHKRHKVCEVHAKAPAVLVAGMRQRFCQQCSRFHELSEFDEAKRSCRRRLAGHNERRRKCSNEPHGEGSSGRKTAVASPAKEAQFRISDERARFQVNIPGNPPYKRSQIRY